MSTGNNTLYAVGLLWLRVLMGIGIAHHGYGKVFGGPYSLDARLKFRRRLVWEHPCV